MSPQRISTNRVLQLLLLFVAGIVATVAMQVEAQAEANDAVLQVAPDQGNGAYITDAEGMALYLFTPDEAGESTCYDQCAVNWPPLLTEGTPAASEGIDESLIGTVARTDGTTQVTYGGWPLYYFVRDENPEDINGQGINEVWFLVSPTGTQFDGTEAEQGVSNEELKAELMSEGVGIYGRHCSVCHGRQAEGGAGPSLVDSRDIADTPFTIRQILFGGHMMPGFERTLSDREVAAVATFVRNSWGNEHPIITEEEVREERN